jgi:hypothetical protein
MLKRIHKPLRAHTVGLALLVLLVLWYNVGVEAVVAPVHKALLMHIPVVVVQVETILLQR